MIKLINGFGIAALLLCMYCCESETTEPTVYGASNINAVFPSFITPVEDYFDTRIGEIPVIATDSYQLIISGAVDRPGTFSLEELMDLALVSRTLTTECIGNPGNGDLLGTAEWKGFLVYDLLEGLGIIEEASTVKYISADGYYSYNSLEELKKGEIIGALFMNDNVIPAKYGFPLRIIFPGYYGVRHPGWIKEIEVLESGDEDFWTKLGWQTDSAMAVDSKIFFPANNSTFTPKDTIKIGGAAYGGKRISFVEISLDDGLTWIPTTIRQRVDNDFVWIFWEFNLLPQPQGIITIRSRATTTDGIVQPWEDNDYLDGTNSILSITISVE